MSELLDALRFPLTGTRLIEASAGTGKTYTLAALYLRLVLGHGGNQPRLPPDILVVTFTEAATRELRDRIRARLAAAARVFAGHGDEKDRDDFLRQLMQDYPVDTHPRCATLLEQAAQWMDEAAIYTIHGFCNRMLRQHAFDSGSLFTLTLQQDDQGLLEQVCADYWRTFVYPLNDACSALFLEQWQTPTALLKAVRPLLGKSLTATPAPQQAILEHKRQIQAKLQPLRERWGQWADELQSMLESAWQDGRLKKGKPSQPRYVFGWLNKIREWARRTDTMALEMTNTFFEKMTVDAIAASGQNLDDLLAHPALQHLDELRDTTAGLPSLPADVLPHAADWINTRLDRHKRQHGLIGYDDMLLRLRDALFGPQGEALANSIRQQFPVAMIDEFQDTDPVQYQVFSALYGGGQTETTWLMIGDPKQAIYGFRGADIHTYLSARRATEGAHYTLARNFRSSTALVEAVNHLFSYADQWPAGSFLYRDIPFQKVQAQGRKEQWIVDGEQAPAMTFWQLHAEGNDPSLSKGHYLKDMAERCASHIVELLQQAQAGRCGFASTQGVQPLRPADIAILVRDGGEADQMRRALSLRGLRSVYLSDKDSVFASNEARDLLVWLEAVAEPESEQRVRAALASATLDLDWQELDRLVQDEQYWEDKVSQFHQYHQLWQQSGVLPMIRALLRDYQVPSRLLARQDERCLTNLLHLAELAQRAATTLDGEQALVRWLRDMIDQDSGAVDEAILRLESDADLIRIVTIHKSKGLEYPLVFLPFICTFRRRQADHLPVSWHDAQGEAQLTLEPNDAIMELAERERLAEDLRLLYVAVTRARYACWLGLTPLRYGNRSNHTDLPDSAIGHVLCGGEGFTPEQLDEKIQALVAGCAHMVCCPAPAATTEMLSLNTEQTPLPEPRQLQRHHSEHWWIASYSALSPDGSHQRESPRDVHDDIIAEEYRGGDIPVVPDAHSIHAFPRGARAGTLLHDLLEWAAGQGFARVLTMPEDSLQEQLGRRLQVTGWEDWRAPLAQWLRNYLNAALPLSEIPLRLAELNAQHYQAEMEFWLQSNAVSSSALDTLVQQHVWPGIARPALRPEQLNGMLKGFIDLVVCHQGRYFVADYKSNWIGPDASSYQYHAMQQVVLEKRYDVQLCLYLLALHRLLRSRLGEQYQPTRHLGGSALLFLRGIDHQDRGVCLQPASAALVQQLDALFRGQLVEESSHVH